MNYKHWRGGREERSGWKAVKVRWFCLMAADFSRTAPESLEIILIKQNLFNSFNTKSNSFSNKSSDSMNKIIQQHSTPNEIVNFPLFLTLHYFRNFPAQFSHKLIFAKHFLRIFISLPVNIFFLKSFPLTGKLLLL